MNLEAILVTALILGFVQAKLFHSFGLKRLSYTRYFADKAVFAGDKTELVEQITNDKLLPAPLLRLESSLSANLLFEHQDNLEINSGQIFQNHKSLFGLMPYTSIKRRHFITCAKRGYYRLTSVSMTCGDILGISSVSQNVAVDAGLLVYPKIMAMEDIPLPSHSWLGEIVVKRWLIEDPFMLAGIREYQAGDALNRINWKATAKSGGLQVQKRDYTSEHRLLIYVNFEISEKMWDAVTDPELVERAISYAASIAQYTISRGVETGFGCNGQLYEKPGEPVRIEANTGSTHLLHLLETMARLEIVRSRPIDTFLEEDLSSGLTHADILIITAFVSGKMRRLIDDLQRMGNAVEIIRLNSADKRREMSANE